MPECPLTELDTRACSHCRGLDVAPGDRMRAGARIIAHYPGKCSPCESWFAAGEPIVKVEGGWAHEGCAS